MNFRSHTNRLFNITVVLGLAFSLSACQSGSDSSPGTGGGTSNNDPVPAPTSAPAPILSAPSGYLLKDSGLSTHDKEWVLFQDSNPYVCLWRVVPTKFSARSSNVRVLQHHFNESHDNGYNWKSVYNFVFEAVSPFDVKAAALDQIWEEGRNIHAQTNPCRFAKSASDIEIDNAIIDSVDSVSTSSVDVDVTAALGNAGSFVQQVELDLSADATNPSIEPALGKHFTDGSLGSFVSLNLKYLVYDPNAPADSASQYYTQKVTVTDDEPFWSVDEESSGMADLLRYQTLSCARTNFNPSTSLPENSIYRPVPETCLLNQK